MKSEEFKFVFTRFDAKNFRDNTNFNVSSIKKKETDLSDLSDSWRSII